MSKATLLILAAGLGSRYQSQKQVDAVGNDDESLMEFALFDALEVGFRKFVFIINVDFPENFKNKIKHILETNKANCHFVYQTLTKYIPENFHPQLKNRKKPLGTAHAVFCAQELIREPFITINADDFYGRKSFLAAYQAIDNHAITSENFGMIAFPLYLTLSDFGSVSRGICQINNGDLQHVEEYIEIKQNQNEIVGTNISQQIKNLDRAALVSMNFWILHPIIFEYLSSYCNDFFLEEKNLDTAEFFLPTVINKLIQQNKIVLKVYPSSEKWFGLTYPKDKEQVIHQIKALQSQGIYPQNLWKQI